MAWRTKTKRVKPSHTLWLLLSGRSVSLASWFASPLTRQQAEALLPTVAPPARGANGERQDGCSVRLAELILRYWRGYDVDAAYRNGLAVLDGQRDQAMLELCYGQLLIARKISLAWQHLDKGFQLAAHLLQPEDYFVVLGRHELLRVLVLSDDPSKPLRLDELLTEAKVIQRLRAGLRGTHWRTPGHPHCDTTD